MKYSRSGQFNLSVATITTNNEHPIVLDISTSFIDISIYESIFTGVMSGAITIVDTYNLIQRYGFGNGEKISLQWNTVGIENSEIFVQGIVYDINGPNKINEHTAGYTLHFSSVEMINSNRKKLFNGYKNTPSFIVSDIFKKIERGYKTKKLDSIGTKNIEEIVLTGNTPLQAIQLLSKRSVSKSGEFGYIFYEDNEKFNFKPIEYLYKQPSQIEYFYRDSAVFNNVDNAHEESFNVVQDFSLDTSNSFSDSLLDGQYGSQWGTLALEDKTLNIYQYDIKKDYSKSKSLGSSPVMLDRNFNSEFLDSLNIMYTLYHQQNESSRHKNKMTLLRANNIVFNIGVFGNSSLKVGTVCNLNVPSFSTDSLGLRKIDLLSGKFLISEIKHIITPKSYNQRIQVIKDAFEETIA
jgi:hypothetical protein